MTADVQVFCFAASYGIALILELIGLRYRAPWRRLAMLVAAGAGIVAHTWFLGRRATELAASPLASPADWCLLAAWVLAAVYFAQAIYYGRKSMGLFFLPLVLVLIGAAQLTTQQPFAPQRASGASRFWGNVHGIFLLLGTVVVSVGFLAGVMYLVQSHRLKKKLPASRGLRLPSLEWLERINSRSLGLSALLIGVGFASGVVLRRLKHRTDIDYLPWTDPVVISLGLMLLWLVVAELFRLIYPSARRGRKVAYLTVAAFVFLCLTLVSLLWIENQHGNREELTGSRAPPTATGLPQPGGHS